MSHYRVVAFGGGHGLFATLRALRKLACDVTAVVTVADDGGSSGRLRAEFGYLPPGDLRQAFVALAGDEDGTEDSHNAATMRLLQHRFPGTGPLSDHAVGNLILTGAFDLFSDPVEALDHIGHWLGITGRVLPMSTLPLRIEADVVGLDPDKPDAVTVVRGQAEVAVTAGSVQCVRLLPEAPPACPQALDAIAHADWLIFGPGSWFTSVLPHFLVPRLAEAIAASPASNLVVLNLIADSETSGWTIEEHLAAIKRHEPRFHSDVVLADSDVVDDKEWLTAAVRSMDGRLMLHPVARRNMGVATSWHDPEPLAQALHEIMRMEIERSTGGDDSGS